MSEDMRPVVPLRIWNPEHFDATDGFILGDMHVSGVRVELPGALCRGVGKFLSSEEATILTVQYFFASLIAFFDHSPVFR